MPIQRLFKQVFLVTVLVKVLSIFQFFHVSIQNANFRILNLKKNQLVWEREAKRIEGKTFGYKTPNAFSSKGGKNTPSIKTSYNKLFPELERKFPRQKKLN